MLWPALRAHSAGSTPEASQNALAVLGPVAVHLAGMTRTVLEIAHLHDEAARPGPRITGPDAGFLHHAGRAIGLYGGGWPRTGRLGAPHDAADKLRRSLGELHRGLPGVVQNDPGTLTAHGTAGPGPRRPTEQLGPDGHR
ncbi:hypothetical protein [Streptomyces sp. NPDC090080]|uniref:hypothetical protein n=1 Tax=Streptomyces sp. NPDC090080 TaxID=3365939 RepID=UPI0037F6F01F